MTTVIVSYNPHPEVLRTFKAEILSLVREELQLGQAEVQFYDRVVKDQREDVILRVLLEDTRLVPLKIQQLTDRLAVRLSPWLSQRIGIEVRLVVIVQAIGYSASSNRAPAPEHREADLIR